MRLAGAATTATPMPGPLPAVLVVDLGDRHPEPGGGGPRRSGLRTDRFSFSERQSGRYRSKGAQDVHS